MVGRGVGQIGQDYGIDLRPDDARYPTRYNMRWLGDGVSAALTVACVISVHFLTFSRMEYAPVGHGEHKKGCTSRVSVFSQQKDTPFH